MALNSWKRYKNYLVERAENALKHYKHRRLRSTYRSLKTYLDALFCFEEYADLGIEKTTNRLEGYLVKLSVFYQHIMA